MAKAAVPQTWKLDESTEANLVQQHGHTWHVLSNAAWELWRNRLASVGAAMVLLLLLVAVLAPVIARYDPVQQHYREMLQGPSAAHYFGTDKFGRDIWSRVVWGARRGPGRARARICRSRTRHRRGPSLHCIPAALAQLPVASHYPGHDLARLCHAHPRRPLLPGPGRTPTDSGLGRGSQSRPRAYG